MSRIEVQGNSTPDSWGKLLKHLRLESGQTLREFCLAHDFDPGNVSKIERDKVPPPQTEAVVAHFAKAVGLLEGSPQWEHFMDLASVCAGRIPSDLARDQELVGRLPALLRTIDNRRLTPEQLDMLIEQIRTA